MLLSIVWALLSLLSSACQLGNASKPSGTVLLEESANIIDATSSRLDLDHQQHEELFASKQGASLKCERVPAEYQSGAEALAPHTRGSACYKDVVQTFYDVEAHQFSTDDSIRKRGAIALFLCDAEADSIAVPRECNIGAQGQPSAVGVLDWDDYEVQACIHALHRTPQLWASFDNHRKVFPLLLVIQRQRNGVDEAREIYSEIAQQQQRFLSYASSTARKHAQETEELLAQSAGAIRQLHQTLIGTLAHGSGILRGLSEEITANMSILHAELVNVTSVRIFSSIDDKMNSALKELRKNHECSTETALLRAIDAIRVALIRANSEIANDRASVQKMVAHDGPVATLLDNFGQQQTLAFAASRTLQIELESQNGQLHQAISNLRGVIQEVYRFDAKRRELLEEEIVSKRRSVKKARPLLLSLMPDIASERDDIDWTDLTAYLLTRSGISRGARTIILSLFQFAWWIIRNAMVVIWTAIAFTCSKRWSSSSTPFGIPERRHAARREGPNHQRRASPLRQIDTGRSEADHVALRTVAPTPFQPSPHSTRRYRASLRAVSAPP